ERGREDRPHQPQLAMQPARYLLKLAGHEMVVRRVVGREALSEPFRFALALHLPDGVRIDPDAVVKAEATLAIERDAVERTITGVVSEVGLSETRAGAPELTVVLEPRFALAHYRSNVKAFLHRDVRAIVGEVLGELGISFEMRLGDAY